MTKPIRAYKAFNADLICNDFQYQVGQTYQLDEPLRIYHSGFHACTTLSDVFYFYNVLTLPRLCEVELLGNIQRPNVSDVSILATNKIKIVRELKQKDVKRLVMDSIRDGKPNRKLLIYLMVRYPRTKIDPQILLNLPETEQSWIATWTKPHYQQILVQSPYPYVRETLARSQNKRIQDMLLQNKDEDFVVLNTLAEYGHDSHRRILAKHENPYIRLAVIKYGNTKVIDLMLNTEEDYNVLFAIVQLGLERQKAIAKQRLKDLFDIDLDKEKE